VGLYANGIEIRSADIPAQGKTDAVKWRCWWTLPRPKHDIYLVAIATGPGIAGPYWPTAKPFQPTSDHFGGYVIGSTGPVWIDADGSGRFDSARDYATTIVEKAGIDPAAIAAGLADYDEAVAAQAAGLLRKRSEADFESTARAVVSAARVAPTARRGFEAYLREWRQSQEARPAASK
jgi:hypothetical protein